MAKADSPPHEIDAFEILEQESDRISVWKLAEREAIEVLFEVDSKNPLSPHFLLQVEKLDAQSAHLRLKVMPTGGSIPLLKPEANSLLILMCSSGMYRCHLSKIASVVSDKTLQISVKAPMDRMQRRGEFRNRVPMTPGYHFSCVRKNGQSFKKMFSLLDVSAGGISFRVEQNESFALGDLLEGELQIAGRPPISTRAIVRHQKPQAAGGILRVGVQFTDLDREQRQELQSLGLFLYRLKI